MPKATLIQYPIVSLRANAISISIYYYSRPTYIVYTTEISQSTTTVYTSKLYVMQYNFCVKLIELGKQINQVYSIHYILQCF